MDNPVRKRRVNTKREVIQHIDTSTGEVLNTTVTTYEANLFVASDDFFFTYASVLKITAGTTPLEGLLLQAMCFSCEFNKNIIHVSPYLRKKWCEDFKCTKQSLSNAIQGLKKKGLIVDMMENGRGSYLINPNYMFRGDQKGRYDAYQLMMKITTNIEGDINIKKQG